jgi:hypothetical protein
MRELGSQLFEFGSRVVDAKQRSPAEFVSGFRIPLQLFHLSHQKSPWLDCGATSR